MRQYEFILIDDDHVVLTFGKLLIKKNYENVVIKTFDAAVNGLNYLKNSFPTASDLTQAILLLDINMPEMDGWEFLEAFEKLDEKIKNLIKIYILSSSVDERDKKRASLNRYVVDYLLKPLDKNDIARLQ